MNWEKLTVQLVTMVVAVVVGLAFFAAAYFVIEKATPFSVRKEIEEDQNTALAILIGSVILGIAIIIAAAIHGT
jgi:putative membrane protein